MQVPFTDPVSAALLFIQSLFIYLHYATTGFWAGDHWGVYFLPTFIGLFFIVIMFASEALFEGRKRLVQGINEISQTTMSHVLFQMLTGVSFLFTLVLFVWYLDEDTDLPFYWITASFFVTTLLFAIAMVLMYQAHSSYPGGPLQCPPHRQASKVYFFVALLASLQGLFLWLYDSPWGTLMAVSPWVVALPTFLFLAASFYRTIMQTYQKRGESGPNIARQFAFLFLILAFAYVILAMSIHLQAPDITWTQPRWIALPFMIFTVVLVAVSIYVYTQTHHTFTSASKMPVGVTDYDLEVLHSHDSHSLVHQTDNLARHSPYGFQNDNVVPSYVPDLAQGTIYKTY